MATTTNTAPKAIIASVADVASKMKVLQHQNYLELLGTSTLDSDFLGGVYYPVIYEGEVLFYLTLETSEQKLTEVKLQAGTAKALTHLDSGKTLGLPTVQDSSAIRSATGGDVLGSVSISKNNLIKAAMLGYLAPSKAFIDYVIGFTLITKVLKKNSYYNAHGDAATVAAMTKPQKNQALAIIRAKPMECLHVYSYNYGSDTAFFVRTSKPVDDEHVVKWRRPPASSSWPYTIEHLWFLARESPVSQLHHQMVGLLGAKNTAGYRQKLETISSEFPVFDSINTMKSMKSVLENWLEMLSDKFLPYNWTNYKGAQMFITLGELRGLRWPSTESQVHSYVTMVQAMVALKVRPTFDNEGNFVRFAELEASLSKPTDPIVYVGVEDALMSPTTQLPDGSLDPSGGGVSGIQRALNGFLLMCYNAGLIEASVLDKWLTDTTANLAVKYSTSDYCHIPVGSKVMFCVSISQNSTWDPPTFIPKGKTNYADLVKEQLAFETAGKKGVNAKKGKLIPVAVAKTSLPVTVAGGSGGAALTVTGGGGTGSSAVSWTSTATSHPNYGNPGTVTQTTTGSSGYIQSLINGITGIMNPHSKYAATSVNPQVQAVSVQHLPTGQSTATITYSGGGQVNAAVGYQAVTQEPTPEPDVPVRPGDSDPDAI